MPVNGPHLSAAARLAINLLKRAARIALEVAFPHVVMRHRTCINARELKKVSVLGDADCEIGSPTRV